MTDDEMTVRLVALLRDGLAIEDVPGIEASEDTHPWIAEWYPDFEDPEDETYVVTYVDVEVVYFAEWNFLVDAIDYFQAPRSLVVDWLNAAPGK